MSQSQSSVSLHSTKKGEGNRILQVTVLTPDDVLLVFEKRDGVVTKISSRAYNGSKKRFAQHNYFLAARGLAKETFNPKTEDATDARTWHQAYDIA